MCPDLELSDEQRRNTERENAETLRRFPRWERPIVHLFAKPYYYDFNADLEMKVDLRGVKADENGTALYELMMLR
jgi:hypothetical protein